MRLSTLKINNSLITAFLKDLCPPLVWKYLYKKLVIKKIPSFYAYKPHYSPWLEPKFYNSYKYVKNNTGLSAQSLYTLTNFLSEVMHLKGDVIECGVWRGGSAKLLLETILVARSNKSLYLFDSFAGMETVNKSNDRHRVGDFNDTSLDAVKSFVQDNANSRENLILKKGWIPATFKGLDDMRICFAHVDLDLYQSIQDALDFIYPRLARRGIIVFDDYGFASCPGAKKAVDKFFQNNPENIFVLNTGQAFIIKH